MRCCWGLLTEKIPRRDACKAISLWNHRSLKCNKKTFGYHTTYLLELCYLSLYMYTKNLFHIFEFMPLPSIPYYLPQKMCFLRQYYINLGQNQSNVLFCNFDNLIFCDIIKGQQWEQEIRYIQVLKNPLELKLLT